MSNPFQVVGGNAIDESEQNKGLDLSTRCANLINSAPIMLFMKGTPDMPQWWLLSKRCEDSESCGCKLQYI